MSTRICGMLILPALLASTAILSPQAAALEDVAHAVFVPNRGSADIAVIDTRTDQVAAHIQVGNVPHQVAVSDTMMKLVASNTADDTIALLSQIGGMFLHDNTRIVDEGREQYQPCDTRADIGTGTCTKDKKEGGVQLYKC